MALGKMGSEIKTSVEVRQRLIEALILDLVGPWAGHVFAEDQFPG